MANIKVAVRIRPISARELNLTGSEVVVHTDANEISLTNLKVSSSKAGDSRERTRKYGFDYCFDSSEPQAENFADQAKIYQTLGQPVLDAVFSGYNSCLVAYGQSASGKTYTMMGTKEDPGLTPRLCEGLFARIEQQNEKYCVSVSYLEIYNERVRDLLKSSSSAGGLRVREHPRLGPYVQGLTQHVVRTLGTLMSYVEEGTKARKTASTLQNPSSSRSHALLTIAVATETQAVGASKKNPGRGGSKLRLVDLAGSESAATCSGVHRLKEGANINKSLVALGNVISALAERGSTGSGPGRRFIPYRDSSLTWLLKDALGGNATTIMLATISPASGSYNETAHTLRFAQRAQSVVNRPVVNEDPVARIIRELRAEVDRLKSLLLEKSIPDKALCCCQSQPGGSNQLSEAASGRSTEHDPECNNESQKAGSTVKSERERSVVPLRRSNSSESGTSGREPGAIKKFGSLEFLAGERFSYSRAKVTELNEEEDEISEIHESVFVDIPTLVAVLIKPDDNLQGSSAQIEEICSDEVNEEPIEFIERVNEASEGSEKQDSIVDPDDRSSVNSCHASEAEIYKRFKEKPKFRKQESVDALPVSLLSNLQTSKKFGSVETIQRKREPLFSLERSHTNLEKRSTVPDRAKKLNNIREIDDPISGRSWGKDQLRRNGSNDSDKSLKDQGSRLKSHARKPSLESLKRKTSKDSSSSSSKDEQILISSLARDKLLRRKSSIDQESSLKNHTPIQRAKRAEIVAAVTERLYASRKHSEDPSEMRSPPESTADIKSVTRMKLQEISRKMLGKRRRVCVDTQTECFTVRMRDTASLTETPEITLQDVGVLTDHHEFCEYKGAPVLRMKETSTLTDKPRTDIVRCRDAATSANDLEEFDYEIHSPRNDSGILSDDAQNYAESNLSSGEVSDLHEADRRVLYAESSTNTSMFSSCRSFAVQTPRPETFDRRTVSEMRPENKGCVRQCCVQRNEAGNPEKSVISIQLPDTVSITIESASTLESRITVDNDGTQQNLKPLIKDEKIQTEWEEACTPIDRSKSIQSQTDSRVFRIENIFQDPNNAIKNSRVEGSRARNSITFRNSLGTSYVSQAKETTEGSRDEGFIRDGLITETFINRKRGLRPSSVVYQDPWRCSQVPVSFSSKINSINYEQIVSTFRAPEIDENPRDSELSRGVVGKLQGFTHLQEGSGSQKDETNVLSSDVDHDHAFSDDSLDYNEYNIDNEPVIPKMKLTMDKHENLCPPDVVAHTKKDCPKPSDKDESVNCDFDDIQIEFPKKKPTEDNVQIHDYKSLILGVKDIETSYASAEIDDALDTNPAKSSDKKKVSFSNISENHNDSKQDSKPILKSIIKKRRKKMAEPARASNDDTDDSQNEDRTSLASEDSREDPQCSSEKIRDSIESIEDNRKKVKFSIEELEDEWSSEEDEEQTRRDVVEEYLNEAVIFMRNLNSISEYVNGRKSDRYATSSRARGKRRARQRSWNRDYLEYANRKMNSKEEIDYPEVDEDIVTSTESYDRCMKGIQRLEDCIRRVDRHNELLKEKYDIDCESAGARLGLASPSMDPRVPISNDLESFDRTESAEQREDDDLEKKIFAQLMNVANSICQRNSNSRSNFSDGGSKFRERRNYTKELNGDITGSINLETSGDDQEFETYEVTGNLSFGKALDVFEPTSEDDFLPLRRTNPPSWSVDSSFDDYVRNFDSERETIDKRTDYVVSPKRTGQPSRYLQETDDQRKTNGCKCSCSKDHSSTETAQLLEKLRYPGSPRAKFLELLRERRRIVECSRAGT